MTENGDLYENTLAEKMNRTLKEAFGLGAVMKSKSIAYQLVKKLFNLYNYKRSHSSLNYQIPQQAQKKIPDK